MAAHMENYDLLIAKLDEFIRKFYLNQIIRGGLYSLAVILVLFLGLNFLEHYFYFPADTRKVLFYSFVGISVGALGYWVFSPLLHYFRLGRLISHEQAARIIGQHFSDVEDKLLNILQLRDQAQSASNRDLILASISQKSESIKLVPFKNAIDLSQNRKYLRYTLPPLLLLLVLLVAAPSLILDPTERLIKNNLEFERPAPFEFILDESALKVVQFEDYLLQVEVDGNVLPNEIFIEMDGYQYRLSKESATLFTYRFSKVQENTDFQLYASGIQSKEFELAVLKKPNILDFEIRLNYPDYTQRKDEVLLNIGDLVVPEGTRIDWYFEVENTDRMDVRFGNAPVESLQRVSEKNYSLKKQAKADETYKLFISNELISGADSVGYILSVTPDQYPTIQVQQFDDSTQSRVLYFAGEAADDYGLVNLQFVYSLTRKSGQQEPAQTLVLSKPAGKTTQYQHVWDLAQLQLLPGDQVTYYFEVFDNDGVNGSKSARTTPMVFAMPTEEALEEMEQANNEEIKDRLEKALKESRKVQKELEALREKLLQEKNMDWQNRKELEKLLERQKELQEEIRQAQQAMEENQKNQEQFNQPEENIQEKQEKIEELMEESVNKEMEELMRKIEELMQEMEKEEALEMMEEMKSQEQKMEMDLDRMLELFKQLEVEHGMEQMLDKLEELAEEQEQLSEETKENQGSQEELEQKQEEINKEFDQLQKDYQELQKKNEELQRPKDIGDHEEDMEDIDQDLEDSQEQLEQNENQKAAQKQKAASEKMKKMAQKMGGQMQSGSMQQMQEDMAVLRQILENLVGLSFNQEDLIEYFENEDINTPRYVELVQDQFKIQDDFKIVEDSLVALAKRVFTLESFVTEKVLEIKDNLESSISDLEERKKPQAADHQQRVMKNLNDLALMLNEAMAQMQMQMSGMMSGSQMCNNPGSGQGKDGKVPQDKISQGQKQLNEEMQQMKKGMDKGQPGPGSKEFAEMAARQAALREALRAKQKQLQEQGKGSKELDNMIQDMDKIETELVNKRLTNELLRRQQDILTRLLEHERAERQREQDNKRKSETALEYEKPIPPSMEEYLRKRETEVEQFKTVSPALKPYYRNLVDGYFKGLQE